MVVIMSAFCRRFSKNNYYPLVSGNILGTMFDWRLTFKNIVF